MAPRTTDHFTGCPFQLDWDAGLQQVKQNTLGLSHPGLPSEPIVCMDPRCLQERRTLTHNQRRIDWVLTAPQPAVKSMSCLLYTFAACCH